MVSRNPLLLLTTLLLWFGVGSRIDYGRIPQKWALHRMSLTTLPLLTLLASYSAGIWLFVRGLTWCSIYGSLSLSSFLGLMS